MTTLAVVRDYHELLDCLRARVAELNVSGEILDEVAGLPLRYAAKILSPRPVKTLSRVSFGPTLQVLGLRLQVETDDEALSG
jgi:hypothetical protein